MHSAYVCLIIILKYYQIGVTQDEVESLLREAETFDDFEYVRTGKELGVKVKKFHQSKYERLEKTPVPCIGRWRTGEFFLFLGVEPGFCIVQDIKGSTTRVPKQEFEDNWSGVFYFVRKILSLGDLAQTFNVKWFLGSLVKYKAIYGEVFISSFIMQLMGVFSPILFQIMVDKVIPYNSYSTLYVIGIAMFAVYIFEVVMEWVRSYTFTHTNSRVDVALGTKLFKHLTQLPLNFFASRPVGQVIARVQELDSVRDFLTNNALYIVLDLLFSFVYFILMFIYSPQLTVIVLISVPLYLGTSIILSPRIKDAVQEQFAKSARSQTFLYETVSGMETVKSMALEKKLRVKWEDKIGDYVKSVFKTRKINIVGVQIIQLIGKLVSLAILIFGARMVFANTFTLGELIAFNMFASQVSQPIMRLAQLWQDFQQMSVSIERLGDILNSPTENQNQTRMRLPSIKGRVIFENIIFQYTVDSPPVLDGVNFTIDVGDVVGLVGKSGSGKSTITKLIQKLYVPNKGKIYFDGMDVSMLDSVWMRENMGVVLQENFLFNASIRENIAICKPSAPIEEIIKASEMAGCHEFIAEFQNGYDTVLEERGSNLSGGQRQRIAIARALLNDPKVLIFDEATSALDYASERIIQDNMKHICKGRTVFIVAHRLSAINMANKIICMDKGKVAEMGSREELMKKKGLYYFLHSQQER